MQRGTGRLQQFWVMEELSPGAIRRLVATAMQFRVSWKMWSKSVPPGEPSLQCAETEQSSHGEMEGMVVTVRRSKGILNGFLDSWQTRLKRSESKCVSPGNSRRCSVEIQVSNSFAHFSRKVCSKTCTDELNLFCPFSTWEDLFFFVLVTQLLSYDSTLCKWDDSESNPVTFGGFLWWCLW